MKEKRLYLTLKKKWFDLIASGKKKVEYRTIKPYWKKRLNKKFDEVHFRNGCQPNSPFMRVEYKGHDKGYSPKDVGFGFCFRIKLGKILEIKNYRR